MEITDKTMPVCETCIKAKLTKTPFELSQSRAKKPLDLVHTDLTGPARVESAVDKHRYAINFVDDHSRFIKIYTMKRKSEALNKLKLFIADYGKPKTLRNDKGGEYESSELIQFCLDNGIRREETITRTPEQNARSERAWRTAMEIVRSLISTANLGNEWWGRAIIMAADIMNKTIHSATGKTPYELFYGGKPNLANMRTFGCKVYIHNDRPNRGKLDDRGLEGIFVGYGEHTKGWIVYLPKESKLVISRNARFLETQTQQKLEFEIPEKPKELLPEPRIEEIEDEPLVTPPRRPRPPINLPDTDQIDRVIQRIRTPEKVVTTPERQVVERRTSERLKKNAGEWWKTSSNADFAYHIGAIEGIEETETPKNFKIANSESKWRIAMKEEYDSLITNKTWTLTKLPPGRKAIGSKWCYKIKQNADGTVARYKARLVAKGFTQIEDVDFTETFAPVVKQTTLRTFLAYAAKNNMTVCQLDVSTAYLHADVEEELYMEQPEGFEVKEKKSTKMEKPVRTQTS